jgi:hypothetical protein
MMRRHRSISPHVLATQEGLPLPTVSATLVSTSILSTPTCDGKDDVETKLPIATVIPFQIPIVVATPVGVTPTTAIPTLTHE